MSLGDAVQSWYLAQLKPNARHIAERNLKRQGFAVFCPLERSTRRAKGKAQFDTGLRPYFPGYLFVGLDAAQGRWGAINSTQGVGRLVSFGGKPSEVPTALIAELQARCDAENVLSADATVLAPEDMVRFTKGPFADLLAEVEQIAPDQRVWVLMDILSGKTRVAVPVDHLQKLP